MNTLCFRTILSAGIAVFSMFFGAGNVVFPLVLGQIAADQNFYATLGLLLTAVGGPLLGLLGATMFHGNSWAFFSRAGKVPGYTMMIVALGLLGPFAVMPRCVTVTYAAMQQMLPSTELWMFSILFGAVALLCCFRKNRLLMILGYVLSPLLLACLVTIIIRGITSDAVAPASALTAGQAMREGLFVGYDTMDLIASLFFSATIWHMLDHSLNTQGRTADTRAVFSHTLAAGVIGGALLGAIYVGLSYVAATHSILIGDVPQEKLMTTLAYMMLGSTYGAVANIAIGLACLTTVVSLAVTIMRLIQQELAQFGYTVSRAPLLFGILGVTTLFANLGFSTLMLLIHPIVALCYPAIIVLTLCNILHKLYGWNVVKIPVFLAFVATVVLELMG